MGLCFLWLDHIKNKVIEEGEEAYGQAGEGGPVGSSCTVLISIMSVAKELSASFTFAQLHSLYNTWQLLAFISKGFVYSESGACCCMFVLNTIPSITRE